MQLLKAQTDLEDVENISEVLALLQKRDNLSEDVGSKSDSYLNVYWLIRWVILYIAGQ